MKFRCKYEYNNHWGHPQHIWICIGAKGAIHFHVSDMGEDWAKEHGRDMRYSGGLEVHYRQPPNYMRDNAPSQDDCFILKAPCWHDGTSLYATETVIPFWLVSPHDHERMFGFLQRDYVERFESKDD